MLLPDRAVFVMHSMLRKCRIFIQKHQITCELGFILNLLNPITLGRTRLQLMKQVCCVKWSPIRDKRSESVLSGMVISSGSVSRPQPSVYVGSGGMRDGFHFIKTTYHSSCYGILSFFLNCSNCILLLTRPYLKYFFLFIYVYVSHSVNFYIIFFQRVFKKTTNENKKYMFC